MVTALPVLRCTAGLMMSDIVIILSVMKHDDDPLRGALRRAALVALALVGGTAAPSHAEEAGWAALRMPGTHAVMRHARAPGTGDPPGFRLGDCSTQRNLDEEGRQQARRIGDAFRANRIVVDVVLTSAWCRAAETAELLDLAPVTTEPALNSFFSARAEEERQTSRLVERLADLGQRKAVLVTHQVNVTALTDVFPSSGEIVVVSVTPDGSVAVKGRIEIE
jgi:phosphohistidine phosphatase SixA